MFDLYFNIHDGFDQKLYIRSMNYMAALDSFGNEHIEIYDSKKFILVEEYFKKANLIGRYITDYNGNKLILVYDSDSLGISYDEKNGEYGIIPSEIMMQYHNSYCYDLGAKADNLETEPSIIIRNILEKKQLKDSNPYNYTNEQLKHNIKRLSKLNIKKGIK